MKLVIIPQLQTAMTTSLSKPLTGSKQAEITLAVAIIPLSLPVASQAHLLDFINSQNVSGSGHGAGAGDVHDPLHDPHPLPHSLPGQVRGVSCPLQEQHGQNDD